MKTLLNKFILGFIVVMALAGCAGGVTGPVTDAQRTGPPGSGGR